MKMKTFLYKKLMGKEGFLKRLFILLLIALSLCLICLVWTPGGYAQQAVIYTDVQINSSPNPVGSGARALGMGGAFIAVADDATAASWNPGGLMQLERPEFSFVFNFDHRRKYYDSSIVPESNGMNEVYREDLNYFSIAYPFRAFDKNMIISLNYQRLYDFYDDVEFDQNYRMLSSGTFTYVETHTDFKQSGALKAFAPAFAIQLTPRFSVGVTFNFWTDNLGYDNEWEFERKTTWTASIHASNRLIRFKGQAIHREKNKNFEGFNMNFGFLWNINRVVTLGAVLKTPFTGDVDRETYSFSPSFPGVTSTPFRSRESIELHFPMSYGIGLAFRLSDEFTVACDVYRTNWSDFWVKSQQGRTSPITGGARGDAHTHDTTQVRLGCEYLFILERTLVPLRFGVFYEPEPSTKNPDDFYGVSIGTGIMIGNIVLDCCYTYRWGRDVKGDVIEQTQSRLDVDQHNFYISLIYHF
jgi:long-subunit fatty acid transport protein